MTNLNIADCNKRTEDEQEPPMTTSFPLLEQQTNHTTLHLMDGKTKANIFNNHLSPVRGQIYYLTDANNRHFLFFKNDIWGEKVRLIQKYSLFDCHIESIDIRVSGQIQRFYGLNLHYTNFSTGIYRGQNGVLIDNIFTNQDGVRSWSNSPLTTFGNYVFVPKGPTRNIYF